MNTSEVRKGMRGGEGGVREDEGVSAGERG